MYMSFKLLDIFCFLTFAAVPFVIFRARGLLRELGGEAPREMKWSLIAAFCGVFFSVICFGAQNFYPSPQLLQTTVGLYGLTFYALLYFLNPFLRERIGMPARTSARVYLLLLLIGATAMKMGGVAIATVFICACAALGALLWRQYSIVQTIVLLVQLVLSLVVYFLVENPLMWIIGLGVFTNVVMFLVKVKVSNLESEA